MRRSIFLFLLLTVIRFSYAQSTEDWVRLRQYGTDIGINTQCTQPDSACVAVYFTELVYGQKPQKLQYQGLKEQLDTVRLRRITGLFLTGKDWCPLLDSMESHDPVYRQLKAYCMRCLIDDYMADSLTIQQVKETLNTYRWLNRFPADLRIVVNIPAATLRVIDRQGQTKLYSRVIAGKPATPTPSFAASIPSMVMYPYWNVPKSITYGELLPKIRKNPTATLQAMKLQVIDNRGNEVDPATVDWKATTFPYRLRQSTGCDNALGILKFNVSDPYDVYLHDTNARQLFAQENRHLSHGCVRVEKPDKLANLLLGYQRFAPDYLNRWPVNATPKTLTLTKPVPVITVYNVLDMDEIGAIRVYKDVYHWWRPTL